MQAQITSIFNGKTYGTRNGKFSTHIKQHGLTYQEYYEKYISGKPAENCPYCEKPRKFLSESDSYRDTCGTKACSNKAVQASHLARSSDDVKASADLRKKTVKDKYGVDNVAMLDEVQAKLRASEQIVKESGLTAKQEQQAATRATKLVKYGNEFYNNAGSISATKAEHTVERKNEINAKRSETNIEKYGVENTLLLPENCRKTAKGNASIKPYIMPSGIIVGIRGVENFALDIILASHRETDIVIHNAYESSAQYVTFEYTNENRRRAKYYPDILIKSENKIIEVKSQWWYDGNGAEKYKGRLANNLRKRQAALDAGYKFEFWIFGQKGNYMVI